MCVLALSYINNVAVLVCFTLLSFDLCSILSEMR